MPPVPDKANVDDSESLFDFLDANDDKPMSDPASGAQHDGGSREKSKSVFQSARSSEEDKPFPVIRKPVCVTQTGALRPPRPGDPVEPPPPLTDGLRIAPVPAQRPERAEIDLSDLDDLNLDLDNEDWPGSDQWVDQTHRSGSARFEEPKTSKLRKAGYGLAGLLIISGVVAALYSTPPVRSWIDGSIGGFAGASSESSASGENLASSEVSQNANTLPSPDINAPKTLNTLFREELAGLELMLDQGKVDEAEIRIRTMDRAVYGYGAPEFTEINERIANMRQGGSSDAQVSDAQVTEQQNAEQQARALEEQRIAAELELQRQAEAERAAAQALAAEQQRAAAEAERAAAQALAAEQQRAAAEAERAAAQALAAEQQRAAAEAERAAAQRAEQERELEESRRLALQRAEEESAAEAQRQLELQRAERARISAEQIRVDRLAQEQARQEQLALARQERILLEQRRLQQQSAEQAAATAAYQAEDLPAVSQQQQSASIADIAASQREAARQQRLIDARARSAQTDTAESTAQSDTELVVTRVEPALIQPTEPVQQAVPRGITDSDLQLVYGQFAQLQNAIEDRDVNAVIRLTERSGVRIQQVMQMFENNVSIQTRLRNVSTLDASGEIQGTLQITRLVRADGSVTGPPLNLGSVRLSSVRKGDGWSSIRW